MRSSMLSTVSVTSGRLFSAAEAKLTSLIGMTIFNNDLQFSFGEDDTFRAMISAAIDVSKDHTLLGRETVQGPLLDNCFENHIKNQRDKLLNGAGIYGLHFQSDGTRIKDTPLINILAGGVYLPVSFQNIVVYTGHITGGHKKDDKFVEESFFDPMNDLDSDKKLVDLHMFDGASVCRKVKKRLIVVYPMLSCIVGAEHNFHYLF